MKQKEDLPQTVEEINPPEPEQVKAPEPDFLKQYRACYPKAKKFHVTGDGLVFLDRDYHQALSHQQHCGKGELITY